MCGSAGVNLFKKPLRLHRIRASPLPEPGAALRLRLPPASASAGARGAGRGPAVAPGGLRPPSADPARTVPRPASQSAEGLSALPLPRALLEGTLPCVSPSPDGGLARPGVPGTRDHLRCRRPLAETFEVDIPSPCLLCLLSTLVSNTCWHLCTGTFGGRRGCRVPAVFRKWHPDRGRPVQRGGDCAG